MKKLLYCAARGHEGHWEAICLDLDIAVEGKSFKDVQARLNKAIRLYVESALKKPDDVRDRLLNRRAPFLVRMKWTLPFLIANVLSRKDDGDRSPAIFACPA